MANIPKEPFHANRDHSSSPLTSIRDQCVGIIRQSVPCYDRKTSIPTKFREPLQRVYTLSARTSCTQVIHFALCHVSHPWPWPYPATRLAVERVRRKVAADW